MITSDTNKSRFTFSSIFNVAFVLILSVSLTSCGSGSDDGASLAGDLTYEVQTDADISIQISRSYYDGSSLEFSTVESVQTSSSGSASGDLQDGDYKGYRLQASPIGGTEPSSLTLRLLSDGEVIAETSSPQSGQNIWIAETGEFPDVPH
ncbi:hypothetical protein LX73_1056 [Fodinibius salinus]|uniref:Uncharacterized protein n=1 Tax=Fodinibius salinus TaxID=860790 RepID=A0A5D3YIG8_9BACT|nr:hypothetical protein [Fodinibius salinus]TYP93355.1 hypothetical protein LX73_1056 [Fodinibius salinus]